MSWVAVCNVEAVFVALSRLIVKYREADTAVDCVNTCVELEALPVSAPTKLFAVTTPVPVVPAPIVRLGTLGLTLMTSIATSQYWRLPGELAWQNTRKRSPATVVDDRLTCVAELALPVRAPTKLFAVTTPVPPTPAPIVRLGVLGWHFMAVPSVLDIWISAAVVLAKLGVNMRYRSLATVVDERATCEALEAFPVRSPTKELLVITPDPAVPAPRVKLGIEGLTLMTLAAMLLYCRSAGLPPGEKTM